MKQEISITGNEPLETLRALAQSNSRIVLGRSALTKFLTAFVESRIDANTLTEIACLLECESVEYEAEQEAIIAQVIFELSSPEINRPISLKLCSHLISALRE